MRHAWGKSYGKACRVKIGDVLDLNIKDTILNGYSTIHNRLSK